MKKPFDTQDEKYIKRIEKRLAYTEVVDEFDPPKDDDVVIWGSFSRTWRNQKKRQLKKGRGAIVSDRIDSPTAHARDYLMFCYQRRPARADQKKILRARTMPIHVRPCIMLDASYVDIRAAWYSILLKVGWNCEYWPGKWLGRGEPPADFPLPDHKVARSAMVTIARSSMLPVWQAGKMTYQRLYNPIENLHIWAVISDVLHCLARIAVEHFECRYVATDGFIIPTRHVSDFTGIIESVGLDWRVKWQGPAIVSGAGAYISKDKMSHRPMSFHEISNLNYDIDMGFLLTRLHT